MHNPSTLIPSDIQLGGYSASKQTLEVRDGTYRLPKVLYVLMPSGCETHPRLNTAVPPTMSVEKTWRNSME